MTRASGWGALVALAASLSASPLGRALAYRTHRAGPHVAAFRRALGLTAAALATVHGALALGTYLDAEVELAWELAWTRAGLLAWLILAALAVTSSTRLVRLARVRAWKPLHRLAYVAGLLALQHVLLAPLASRGAALALLGATLALGALRALPRPDAAPPEP